MSKNPRELHCRESLRIKTASCYFAHRSLSYAHLPSFFVFRDTTGRVLPISLCLVFFGDWKLKVFSVAERSDIAEKCVFVLNLQSSPQFPSRDFTSLHGN